MAQQAPPEVIGIRLNFSGAPDVAKALQSGGPPPAGLSAEEQRAYEQMTFLKQHVPIRSRTPSSAAPPPAVPAESA
jgi:hypothetical protein